MGYFCICKKCGGTIFHGEFRFQVPEEDYDYLCNKCFYELKDIISDWIKNDVPKQNSEEKLCPCGHEHKPRSDGRGLRTYCVEGSQCNSDKCKEYVSLGADE